MTNELIYAVKNPDKKFSGNFLTGFGFFVDDTSLVQCTSLGSDSQWLTIWQIGFLKTQGHNNNQNGN